jgi:hypothetical protein
MITVSKKVFVKHRRPDNIHRVGEGEFSSLIHKNKIGSSFKGSTLNRGLTHAEENIFMPELVGMPADAPMFRKACDDYWKDICVIVPAPTSVDDTKAALELEIGFHYPNKEAAKLGEEESDSELIKHYKALEENRIHTMDFSVRVKLGRPINLPDWILYRYCLVYSDVAKTESQVNMSNRIRFYMTSPELENKGKAASLAQRKLAMAAYLEVLADEQKAENLYYALDAERKILATVHNQHYDNNVQSDIELCLEKIANMMPERFLVFAKDTSIQMRAFVVRCLENNYLRRIPNTDRIVHGDNTILGNSVSEAVSFLTDEKNLPIKQELDAKMEFFKKSK